MMIKKRAKVNSDLVGRVLDYVTSKYNLSSDYSLSGFKKGKSDLQITVTNNQAEMTVKIFGSDMYELLEEDLLDEDEDGE